MDLARSLAALLMVAAPAAPAMADCPPPPAPAPAHIAPALVAEVQKPPVDPETGAVKWWIERHREKLADLASRADAIEMVWIGDSITHGFETTGETVWREFYGDRHVLNLGFSGDRTENVLWRFDHGEIEGLHPKLFVVMIGTNNTGHRQDPPEETAAGIAAIVERLKAQSPTSKILLLAIFPRGEMPDNPMRLLNQRVNALIAPMADGKTVHYMDIGDRFLDRNGRLSPETARDFVHPGESGYRIWAEAIEPTVKALMQD